MTKNMEDYLKVIYEEGGEHNIVSNKTLVKRLGIAPASVTEMVLKLQKQGLIYYEAYKGSKLTSEGLRNCIGVVRSHRLWEVFLIEYLGFSWSEAHEEAHLLEHAASVKLVNALDEFLKHPAYCPHGSVIPGNESRHEEPVMPLSELPCGARGVLRRVVEEKELLDYIEAKGLRIGTEIQLIEKEAYEGPIHLQWNDTEIQISCKAADKIYVEMKA